MYKIKAVGLNRWIQSATVWNLQDGRGGAQRSVRSEIRWGGRAWRGMLAGWCEVEVVSTMSEGWIRVNGDDADERWRDATTSVMPAAIGKGLWVAFTIVEVVPGPVDAFDPEGRRYAGARCGTGCTA